jgi:hypothetical protein
MTEQQIEKALIEKPEDLKEAEEIVSETLK